MFYGFGEGSLVHTTPDIRYGLLLPVVLVKSHENPWSAPPVGGEDPGEDDGTGDGELSAGLEGAGD